MMNDSKCSFESLENDLQDFDREKNYRKLYTMISEIYFI